MGHPPENQATLDFLAPNPKFETAKSDAQIDRSEQEAILSRIGGRNPEQLDFSRKQMEKPLNAKSLVCRTPLEVQK